MPITSSAPNVTSIDRFFSVVQICQNIATMQNNMRANVLILQNSYTSGALAGNLSGAQQAYRDLGTAFAQRLAFNQDVMSNYTSQLAAGAAAIGVQSTDVSARQQLLVNVSSGLATAVFTSSSDVIAGTNQVLTLVPVAMLPF